jgi:hypothetical protein
LGLTNFSIPHPAGLTHNPQSSGSKSGATCTSGIITLLSTDGTSTYCVDSWSGGGVTKTTTPAFEILR